MTKHLRIGTVPYLNAAPLLFFLDEALGSMDLDASVSVHRAPPSHLSASMRRGELDVALMPVVDYLNGVGACILPDISISSAGSVASVLLFARRPVERLHRIGLTTASRSSAALLEVLLKERWRVDARLDPLVGVPDRIPPGMDAMLLIGDDALRARRTISAQVFDLGKEWHDWTGLPFVFAAWIVANPARAETLYALLTASKEEGIRRLPDIVKAHEHVAGMTADEVAFYLTQNVNFDLGPKHIEGIRRFQSLCHQCGILSGTPRDLTYWEPTDNQNAIAEG